MDADGNADMTYKTTVDTLDTTTYAKSTETGNDITNQFADVDIRYYDDSFAYLTRSDWSGSFPSTYADGNMTASDALLSDLQWDRSDDVVVREHEAVGRDEDAAAERVEVLFRKAVPVGADLLGTLSRGGMPCKNSDDGGSRTFDGAAEVGNVHGLLCRRERTPVRDGDQTDRNARRHGDGLCKNEPQLSDHRTEPPSGRLRNSKWE